ncbi:MAG: lytic transglycosylase domain-containing protein [Pseudomonadota bacterium]
MSALTRARLFLRAEKIPTLPILRIGVVRILAARWFTPLIAVLAIGFSAEPASSADTWPVFAIPKSRPAGLVKAGDGFDTARICDLIKANARDYGLPEEFFARLIWKESRFDIKALSPVGAQGIAQFMPATARIRGLKDPWDPVQALPASASFLADLRAQFGNFGLAAAAYNSGPNRVARWLAKGGRLPGETVDYVQSITHRPVEWFRKRAREVEHKPLEKGKNFDEGCRALPIISTRAMGAVARAPWGVQIAAGISRRAAVKAFRRARARASHVIGGRGAIVVRSRKVAGRRLYSARVGAQSRVAARQLCARIRRAGVNCVVRRN